MALLSMPLVRPRLTMRSFERRMPSHAFLEQLYQLRIHEGIIVGNTQTDDTLPAQGGTKAFFAA